MQNSSQLKMRLRLPRLQKQGHEVQAAKVELNMAQSGRLAKVTAALEGSLQECKQLACEMKTIQQQWHPGSSSSW